MTKVTTQATVKMTICDQEGRTKGNAKGLSVDKGKCKGRICQQREMQRAYLTSIKGCGGGGRIPLYRGWGTLGC